MCLRCTERISEKLSHPISVLRSVVDEGADIEDYQRKISVFAYQCLSQNEHLKMINLHYCTMCV